MTTFFLVHPAVLWAAPVVLVAVAGCYFWARRARRRRLALFLTTRQTAKAMSWSQERPRIVSAVLIGLGLALLWSALARPLSGPRPDETRARGIDAYVLLDCSKSMLVPDVEPHRLAVAKRAIMTWRENLVGDRLGLVLIGGDAFVAIPPTLGAEAFNFILRKVTYEFVQGGSNLARGIDAAVEDLTANQKEGKYPKPVIVLVSDGGQTSGDAVAAARAAWENHGIRVYCIGVGTTKGGRVPRTSGPYRTAVSSRLDEDPLRAIAREGGGTYTQLAPTGEPGVGAAILDRLYRTELAQFSTLSGRMEVEDYYEWFQLPLVIGFLLLAAEPFVRRRRQRSLQELEALPVVLPSSPNVEAGPGSGRSGPRLRNRLQTLSSTKLLTVGLALWAFSFCDSASAAAAVDHRTIEKLVTAKNYDEAEKLLREALALEAGNAELSYNLGIVSYARARALEEAGGKEELALARRQYLEAIERFQSVLAAADPSLTNRALFQLGNVKTRLGVLLAKRDGAGVAGGADALEDAIQTYRALEGTPLGEGAKRNASQAVGLFEHVAVSHAKQKLAAAEAKPKNHPRRLADQNGAYGEAWDVLERLAQHQPDSAAAKALQREVGDRWAANLSEMAQPLEAEAERLFALPPPAGKTGRSPKWGDAIKAQSKAVALLDKAAEVAPHDAQLSGHFSVAKARLVIELLELVNENVRTRANAYDVLSGVTMRHLETAEKYATPGDPRVAQARADLLAAMENAAVAEGDKLAGEFERQRGDMSGAPRTHSRLAAMKGATMEAKTAAVLDRAMAMYDKALELNADNAHALYQKDRYKPVLAEAFAKMGEGELAAARAAAGAQPAAPKPQAPGGSGAPDDAAATAAGGASEAGLSTAQMEKAISHLENAHNGFSQAQGMGLSDPAVEAMQAEADTLLASLRSQYEAQSPAAGRGTSQVQGADGTGGGAENVGGSVVETYARHFAKGQKMKSNYDSRGGGWVEKDW